MEELAKPGSPNKATVDVRLIPFAMQVMQELQKQGIRTPHEKWRKMIQETHARELPAGRQAIKIILDAATSQNNLMTSALGVKLLDAFHWHGDSPDQIRGMLDSWSNIYMIS